MSANEYNINCYTLLVLGGSIILPLLLIPSWALACCLLDPIAVCSADMYIVPEQANMVRAVIEPKLEDGDDWYVMSLRWWDLWKDWQ